MSVPTPLVIYGVEDGRVRRIVLLENEHGWIYHVEAGEHSVYAQRDEIFTPGSSYPSVELAQVVVSRYIA